MVDCHIHFVGRILRSFGVSEADVDDAVQQVYLVFAKKIASVREGSERAYLFRTAQRVAYRTRRGRSARSEVSLDGELQELRDPACPERSLESARGFDTLSRIIGEMHETLRPVFVLYEIEQISMVQIAEMLEIPPGTVASRLRRARKEFQQRVSSCQEDERGVA
jgi:RNA polymerase sigma-70 factor (ECF subfamily)